jgi:mannose-1-phosphate guanylyltransferase/phosphomannomutase
MKAIIMAGGFGTRLMPVTALCPKPMIRIMDKPIIEYTLELLKKHNITDALCDSRLPAENHSEPPDSG